MHQINTFGLTEDTFRQRIGDQIFKALFFLVRIEDTYINYQENELGYVATWGENQTDSKLLCVTSANFQICLGAGIKQSKICDRRGQEATHTLNASRAVWTARMSQIALHGQRANSSLRYVHVVAGECCTSPLQYFRYLALEKEVLLHANISLLLREIYYTGIVTKLSEIRISMTTKKEVLHNLTPSFINCYILPLVSVYYCRTGRRLQCRQGACTMIVS